MPVSCNFDVTADCGDYCTTSYAWTIKKPGSAIYINTNSAFTYSFSRYGLYTIEITVTCSDGTTCSQEFFINIDAPIIVAPQEIPKDTIVIADTMEIAPIIVNDTIQY